MASRIFGIGFGWFPLLGGGEETVVVWAGKTRLAGGQNSASVSATNWERFTLTPRVKAGARGNVVHDFARDSPEENALVGELPADDAQTGKPTQQTTQIMKGMEERPSNFFGES